jgi:hypothetical protein
MSVIFIVFVSNEDAWEHEEGSLLISANSKEEAKLKAEELIKNGSLEPFQMFQHSVTRVIDTNAIHKDGFMVIGRGHTE